MRRLIPTALAVAALFALTTGASDARATEPNLGYAFGSFAVPYGYQVKASKPGFSDGQWTTESGLKREDAGLGLGNVGFGAGIGYNGWNLQLDVRSAANATAGTLTGGYRRHLMIGNVELWGRLGVGPALVLDYKSPTSTSLAGGVQTVAEAGLDYVFFDHLALGVKAVAEPSYTWPLTFAADFGLNVGIRLLI